LHMNTDPEHDVAVLDRCRLSGTVES